MHIKTNILNLISEGNLMEKLKTEVNIEILKLVVNSQRDYDIDKIIKDFNIMVNIVAERSE